VTAAGIILWLGANMALWRDGAIAILAAFAVGTLWLAYGAWEDFR
jgi:hypothetical protein